MEPSPLRSGGSASVMSATRWPAIGNSASSMPAVRRSTILSASGPGTRRLIWWRSPMKVSDWPVRGPKFAKQNPIATYGSARQQCTKEPGSGVRQREAHHCPASRNASTPSTVRGRGSRPLRRSKTKRGPPTASLPKRVGAMSLRRKNFSTSLSKVTRCSLCSRDSAAWPSQRNSYLFGDYAYP